jgi:CDP-2,3-bis-(O-geranylgeranyl)-sn-glycerol synthase
LGLTVVDIVLVVTLFTVGEIVLSRLLFRLHIREQPY